TRANYGMIIGNFELDYQDGEIRYKTSVDVEDVALAESLVQNLVYANVLTMDKYLPGLMRVLYAGIEPIAAIEEVEGEGE
ncbi:MAG TPA: YbjN domain-containing protein, partial [Anaerolineaceae bacterium]